MFPMLTWRNFHSVPNPAAAPGAPRAVEAVVLSLCTRLLVLTMGVLVYRNFGAGLKDKGSSLLI